MVLSVRLCHLSQSQIHVIYEGNPAGFKSNIEDIELIQSTTNVSCYDTLNRIHYMLDSLSIG